MRQHLQSSRITISHILILIMALLVGVQVYVSNKIATSGKAISMLEQKALQLEDDNRKLLSDNVENFSLTALSNKARQLGFVEPTAVLHLEQTTSNLALKQ